MLFYIYILLFVLMILSIQKHSFIYWKGFLSIAFVVIAFLYAYMSHQLYLFWNMITGLLLCCLGDIFLASQQKKHFIYGFISFLIANMSFVFSFYHFQFMTIEEFFIPVFAVGLLICLSYFMHMNFHDLKRCVMLYTFVIAWAFSKSLCVYIAFSTRMFLYSLIGFGLYFLSDFVLVFYRFKESQYKDLLRKMNLLLYYLGMFMIAYSFS